MNSITQLIITSLSELNEELNDPSLENISEQTRLFGGNGALDSLALVSFIADIEEKISEQYGKNIVLADEKAMSQKVSPFRTVESLASYIQKLLDA
jgi:acyl carrier protein